MIFSKKIHEEGKTVNDFLTDYAHLINTSHKVSICYFDQKVILEHYNRSQAAPQSKIIESIIEKEILTSPQASALQQKITQLLSGDFIGKFNQIEQNETNHYSNDEVIVTYT